MSSRNTKHASPGIHPRVWHAYQVREYISRSACSSRIGTSELLFCEPAPSVKWLRLIGILFLAIMAACTFPGPSGKPTQPGDLSPGKPTPTAISPTKTATPWPTSTLTPQPLPPGLVESEPPLGVEIPLRGPLTLYFNQPMDQGSVESALANLSGNFHWVDAATLSFTPSQSFPPATQINLNLGTAVRSVNGLAFREPVSLTYQTVGYLSISQRLPSPGASQVDPTSAVIAAFNRPVVALGADPASLNPAFTLEPRAEGHGEWLNTSTYIFYPQPGLAGGIQYTVQINPDLTGVDGSPLEGTEPWLFSTAVPRLNSQEPSSGAKGVRLDASMRLTFNQPMNSASVQDNFSLFDSDRIQLFLKYGWNDDFTTVVFTPTVLLKRDQTYVMVLNPEAQANGGTPLSNGLSAEWRTVPALAVVDSVPNQGGQIGVYDGISLSFSAPIPSKDILNFLTFTPQLPNLYTYLEEDQRTLHLRGDFLPDTAYTLLVSQNLPDVWKGRLGQEFTLNFRVKSLNPSLVFTLGSNFLFATPKDSTVTAQVTNLSQLRMSLGSILLDDFKTMLAPAGYEFIRTYQPAATRELKQNLETQYNRSQAVNISLAPVDKPLDPGLYFLKFNLDKEIYSGGPLILVVSNIHITFKLSATDVMVWAVDLRNNAPVAGVPVVIYTETGSSLVKGKTNSEGIFQANLPNPLKDVYSTSYAVLGLPGEASFGVALSSWDQGLNAWSFNLSTDYSPPHQFVYLYTDRPIYRPNQTVYFRAVARQAYNGRYTLPNSATLTLKLYDGMGEEQSTFNQPISAFGTAHGEFTLPSDATPGYYRLSSVSTDSGTGSFDNSINFQVAEYRKPEINLQVSFEASQIQSGQPLLANVNARYFFDAPAGNIALHWELYKEHSSFYLPGYRVGKEDEGWLSPYPEGPGQFTQVVSKGDVHTSPDGMYHFELTTLPEDNRVVYTLEVTATDESGLPVSGRASIQVNPGKFFIGVRPETWVSQAKSPINFDLLVVDWNKKPVGSKTLQAEFQKVVWEQIESSPGDPYAFPTYAPRYTPIGRSDVVINPDGTGRVTFMPPEPGSYQLSVTGTEIALTQVTVWVGGLGQAIWPNLPNQRLRLTPDQDAYKPGQTAQVFIPNPFGSNVLALMTVERGTVQRYQILAIEGTGLDLSLPLGNEDTPNVYVSITMLGRDPNGQTDFRQGYLNLTVTPLEETLQVELTGEPHKTGPGDAVTFGVLVTDAAGKPVQGEFSLSVVDLAVLALADPNSQDILTAFYGNQPLGVRTGLDLAVSTHRLSFITGGRGGGGGEELAAPMVREKFPDTAFWNAEIVTDVDGKAQITVTLPDSLTTWQVDLRGVTADTRLGQATLQVVTSKDLLVRPVTPRFFVVGDHVLLAAVVQNNTAVDLQVDVSLQANGFVLDDPVLVLQPIALPANGRVRVEWWGTVQDVENVDLIFSASGGGYQDATCPVSGLPEKNGMLPVLHYTTPQTFGTSGILNQAGELLELVSLPRSFDPQGGELSLELSPSLAAAMMNALDALEYFPYECTEQILSRFLPNLETYQVLVEFNLQSPELQARLERTLDEGLAQLLARQNQDGGWGWWSSGNSDGSQNNSSESDPYITAYVLFGLNRALLVGVEVDPVVIRQAVDYLIAGLPAPNMLTDDWQFDRLAFEQFALTQAGVDNLGGLTTLFEERSRLSPWAQAVLSLAIEKLSPGNSGTGSSDQVKTLLSDLGASAQRSASGAHWESDKTGWRNMSSPIHSTAVVLYALAQQDPAAPLVADATRYLMAHRNASGGWASTYETAWTLMALVQVLKGTGELGGNFTYSATLNQAPFAKGQAGADSLLTPVMTRIPISDLRSEAFNPPDAPNALLIQRSAGPGRLYYSAHLTIYRPVDDISPLNRGITISRVYSNAQDNQIITNNNLRSWQSQSITINPIHSIAAGGMVKIHLTLVIPETAYYLIVEDYFPAGSEVLDMSLKTSQQGAADCRGSSMLRSSDYDNCYNPRSPFADGWGWWYFNGPQVYDDHVAWTAETLPPGTYELTYTLVSLQVGEYRVLPARAWQFYFPDVQGNSAGEVFEIGK